MLTATLPSFPDQAPEQTSPRDPTLAALNELRTTRGPNGTGITTTTTALAHERLELDTRYRARLDTLAALAASTLPRWATAAPTAAPTPRGTPIDAASGGGILPRPSRSSTAVSGSPPPGSRQTTTAVPLRPHAPPGKLGATPARPSPGTPQRPHRPGDGAKPTKPPRKPRPPRPPRKPRPERAGRPPRPPRRPRPPRAPRPPRPSRPPRTEPGPIPDHTYRWQHYCITHGGKWKCLGTTCATLHPSQAAAAQAAPGAHEDTWQVTQYCLDCGGKGCSTGVTYFFCSILPGQLNPPEQARQVAERIKRRKDRLDAQRHRIVIGSEPLTVRSPTAPTGGPECLHGTVTLLGQSGGKDYTYPFCLPAGEVGKFPGLYNFPIDVNIGGPCRC